MNEHDGRSLRRKGLTACVGIQMGVLEGDEHLEILVKQRNACIVPNRRTYFRGSATG
jgi:hypothetical protein